MNIAFCGNRHLTNPEKIQQWLKDILPALIENGAETFYLSNYGDFDYFAALAIKLYKPIYKNIRSVLVLAYTNKRYELELYDRIWNPFWQKKPNQASVKECYRLMIEKSHLLIVGKEKKESLLSEIMIYAQRQDKLILQYPFYSVANS